jgi:hypothetical protein
MYLTVSAFADNTVIAVNSGHAPSFLKLISSFFGGKRFSTIESTLAGGYKKDAASRLRPS